VARVIERAKARIVALAGELTWRGKVGDEIKYIDAKRGGNPYSVEYSREEIELLEGHRLSESQVWKAFGREDLRQQVGYGPALDRDKLMAAEIEQEKGRKQSNRRIFTILILVIVLFVIFACLCSSCSSGSVFPSVRSGSVSGPSTGGGFNFGK
jgi:hypothetical protein